VKLHLYQRTGVARSNALAFGDRLVASGRTTLRIVLTLAATLAFSCLAPSSRAQTAGIAGKYQCAQVKVHGKVKPCDSAHLTLKADGHFELRGWEGDYVVSGEYVELSDKLVKSKAKQEPGYKLVFRYHGKDGIVEVTYERRQSAPNSETLG
jgi:hypothetical protein